MIVTHLFGTFLKLASGRKAHILINNCNVIDIFYCKMLQKLCYILLNKYYITTDLSRVRIHPDF